MDDSTYSQLKDILRGLETVEDEISRYPGKDFNEHLEWAILKLKDLVGIENEM